MPANLDVAFLDSGTRLPVSWITCKEKQHTLQ